MRRFVSPEEWLSDIRIAAKRAGRDLRTWVKRLS
jgi:hypothetical protein